MKPAIAPKPVCVDATGEVEKVRERLITEIAERESDLALVQTRLHERVRRREQLRRETRSLAAQSSALIRSSQGTVSAMGSRIADGDDTRLRRLLLDADGETKLISFVEDSGARYEQLQNKWNTARMNMIEAINQARGVHVDEVGLLTRHRDMTSTRMNQLEDELAINTEFVERLRRQLTKMDGSSGNGRRAFTRRIFEIVASVRKQQEEIARVLDETRALQKEITQLTGNLDRTFTAVEERLYRDAQRDPILQKAYKVLLRVHEECGLVTTTLESSGALIRETDELRDQAEIESQRAVDAQLERLLGDLVQVRQSNAHLQSLLDS